METISILPNPFKILEQQIAKKESLNKCNNCQDNEVENNEVENNEVENNKEGFYNLNNKKKIIEGAGKAENSISWFYLFIAIVVSSSYCFIGISINKNNITDLKNKNTDDFINQYMTKLKEDKSIIAELPPLIFFLGLFVGFSFLGAFIASDKDEYNEWFGKPLTIGFIMFVLSKSTAIIDFFENTFGYLLISPWLNLNMYMKSDNFQSTIDQNPNNVSINFNPLITLFNVENLAEKFTQIRFIDDKNMKNKDKPSSDFFAYYEPDETPSSFFYYLLEKVNQKRIVGNSIWLLLTTFFTIGIMKGLNE